MGKRGEKVVALVDVRRAFFYAPVQRKTNTCAATSIQIVSHTRRCTELGRGAGSYAQQPEINEEKCVPVRVERTLSKLCIEMASRLVETGQRCNPSSK